VLDCTNAINYNAQIDDEKPTYRVSLAPNMLGFLHSWKELLLGSARGPGPLSGQWSTAFGAMGQVLSPNFGFDVSSPVSGCLNQCNSVFYWVRYHTLAKIFILFQFKPTSVQFVAAVTFDLLMRILALTGLTVLFFDADTFRRNAHQSAEMNFTIIQARWIWLSQETKYFGADAEFPVPFNKLPSVPKCFSYTWMEEARVNLLLRMCFTLFVAISLVLLQFAEVDISYLFASVLAFLQ